VHVELLKTNGRASGEAIVYAAAASSVRQRAVRCNPCFGALFASATTPPTLFCRYFGSEVLAQEAQSLLHRRMIGTRSVLARVALESDSKCAMNGPRDCFL
jgi:hypothetical protein